MKGKTEQISNTIKKIDIFICLIVLFGLSFMNCEIILIV